MAEDEGAEPLYADGGFLDPGDYVEAPFVGCEYLVPSGEVQAAIDLLRSAAQDRRRTVD